MGTEVIDVDNHKCMTLGSIQTLDCKTLENMNKNFIDWYSNYLISRKDRLQKISNIVVTDAFFSNKYLQHPCMRITSILSVVLEKPNKKYRIQY